MIGNDSSVKLEKSRGSPSEADSFQLGRDRLTELGLLDMMNKSITPETDVLEGCTDPNQSKDEGIFSFSLRELDLRQAQDSENITVRSRRQSERRARRVRAAEKAANSVISVESGSSGKKKRSVAQEVDYSDPLRYLRGTTNTYKLLSANEELELSEGIQVGL